MQIRGIVHSAGPQEYPEGSDRIELIVWAPGVGPNKPRSIVLPYEMLVSDASLDPDSISGHGFQAEIEQDDQGRWIVREIGFAAGRVLRPGD